MHQHHGRHLGARRGADHEVEFSFRLDLSLLPRPFQIGMANQPDWVIEVQRDLEVPLHNDTEPRPDAAPPVGPVEAR